MKIGYISVGGKYKLYVEKDNIRKYYGSLTYKQGKDLLHILEQWNEAGGNDGGITY